jgi:hypothetical protein
MLNPYIVIKKLTISYLFKIFKRNCLPKRRFQDKKKNFQNNQRAKRQKRWSDIPNIDGLPRETVRRLLVEGHRGYNKNFVDVPFTGRKEKCRHCGATIVSARLFDHLSRHCWLKPKEKTPIIFGPVSAEPEWYWEKD